MTSTTRSIKPHTEAFAQMFTKASDDERTVLGEMHLHYEAEIRRMAAGGHEPQNVAHTINGLVDDSVAQTLKTGNGRKVQCKRGCAACCKIHVSITREEAALLLIAAEHGRVAIDWPKVQRQAEHRLATWKSQDPGEQRCVFLTRENACSVYEHRPAACRKYLVASEPKHCNTVKFPGRQVTVVAPVVGETIVSAMLGVLEWGSMPRMLLAVKEELQGEGS